MSVELTTSQAAPQPPPQLETTSGRRLRAVLWAVGVGLLLTAGTYFVVKEAEQAALKADLERRAEDHLRQLESKLAQRLVTRFTARLEPLIELCARLDDTDGDAFAELRQHTLDGRWGSFSLLWVRRVKAEELPAYEELRRQTGRTRFAVRQMDAEKTEAGQAASLDFLSVHFAEPPAILEEYGGLDLASDPTLKEAMTWARDTGRPAFVGRFFAALEQREWNEWLAFYPVYDTVRPLITIDQRRQALRGFASSVTRVKADPLAAAARGGIDYLMFRQSEPDAAPTVVAAPGPIPGFSTPRLATMGDEQWWFLVRPRRELVKERSSWSSVGVLVAGCLATTLLALYVGQSVGREDRIRKLVEERTAQLLKAREEEQHLRMEAQLLTVQKMEAIGNLAGGIAHDFNNLLTGILGSSELLRLNARPGDPTLEIAAVIEQAAQRATELTQQLLGFARRGKHQDAPVDLHETIGEVVALLNRTVDKNIVIRQDLQATASVVKGDPTQLHQIILNLAINARDAMPHGGQLRIETRTVEAQDGDLLWNDGGFHGSFFRLCVADDGCGIAPEVKDRIFEPFFTTKEPGQGTGMGLAMVYGIVKNHRGRVEVESVVGEGTQFQVDLPVDTAGPENGEENPAGSKTEELIRGQGCILLVDDEDTVRSTGSEMLRSLGYNVITARDGEEALRYYTQNGSDVDLVILDMIMPKMGGCDCFRALKEINPGIRAILSTGFGQDGAAQEILDAGMVGFCQKPYRIRYLSEIVQKGLLSPTSG